jgi:GNAT superfamily N-acetyltransferase
MQVRRARSSDVDAVAATLARAFADDPVWGIALSSLGGGTDHHNAYWRFFAVAGVDQESVWLADDGAALAVWVPPGGVELPSDALAELEAFNAATLGPHGAAEMAELYERFESNHPAEPAHAYLSLLATHPDHRGKGIGQALLRENLREWDALGVATYLESTNPANDHRYVRAGYHPVGRFEAVRDGAPITTMWRSPGGSTPIEPAS